MFNSYLVGYDIFYFGIPSCFILSLGSRNTSGSRLS